MSNRSKHKMRKVEINELRFEDLPKSCTMVAIGPPGSGKTSFIVNMCYYKKHQYPVAKVFIGTPDGYNKMKKIFHPLYVSNSYDDREETRHIHRQHDLGTIQPNAPENYAINILDDVTEDPRIFKTPIFRSLFLKGSQHYSQICVVGSQYAIDLPPQIRSSMSYAVLFREPNPQNREKLYKNFGGIAGSKENFYDLMDQLTGDHTCMIIKMRSQSNKLEDNVFWYTTKPMESFGDWKFGCEEYRAWGDQRYDRNYKEEFGL